MSMLHFEVETEQETYESYPGAVIVKCKCEALCGCLPNARNKSPVGPSPGCMVIACEHRSGFRPYTPRSPQQTELWLPGATERSRLVGGGRLQTYDGICSRKNRLVTEISILLSYDPSPVVRAVPVRVLNVVGAFSVCLPLHTRTSTMNDATPHQSEISNDNARVELKGKSVRRARHTTSAMTPSMGSPFVFLTVAEKKSGSPSVEGLARREPEGTRGASVVQKGPGSQERVHPYLTRNKS